MPDPERFLVKRMDRMTVISEEGFPSLAKAKVEVNRLKKLDRKSIKNIGVLVEDTREGTEWHVDPDWKLVEM